MKAKQILVIHPSLGIGGAEKIIAYVANVLSKHYRVTFCTLKKDSITLDLSDSINVDCVPCYSAQPIIGKNLIRGFESFHNMNIKINKIIQKYRPDAILCFDLRVLLSVYLSGAYKNINVIFSERADPYENPKYWAYILKHIYKKIDYIVFQTEGARAFYGNNVDSKSTIIPNPAFPRINSNLVRDDKRVEKTIFAAGRFQRRKGFDLLIRAFDEIHSKYPDYRLLLYGDGEEKNNLLHIIDQYKIKGIVILPPINGVVEKNINASLFVLPSRSEGIPNILIEAMMYSIPSVATDCSPGGAKLLSKNGEYCLLAENDDFHSLSKCMDYALSHINEMTKKAELAQKSLSRFEENKISDMWESTFKLILKG